ncbi:MAG: 50S ribosomal protein L4 [Gemmatimonadetes bacterium]|nr:50S ribosomal protein L4 [Gemmatimonadota bacterium]NIW35783.1 50S ribosomal protein L4 [Gemmatimonadota bacterium]
MKAPIITIEGETSGERDLPETLFDGVVHEPAMWQTVKAYLANQRQGTASTKNRAAVRGGSRKPWRQKGTGRARQGSIRSPQWRGGGRVFGPTPDRNYKQDVPKKVRWLARRSAYNARAQDGRLLVVEALELDAPKTKRIVAMLEKAEVLGNVLILTDGHKPEVWKSARNLQGVQVRPFGEESAYDVLWADTVIVEAAALERAGEVAHA